MDSLSWTNFIYYSLSCVGCAESIGSVPSMNVSWSSQQNWTLHGLDIILGVLYVTGTNRVDQANQNVIRKNSLWVSCVESANHTNLLPFEISLDLKLDTPVVRYVLAHWEYKHLIKLALKKQIRQTGFWE